MEKINRITLIVLDSAGVGELPDANLFGDEGANTFGHIADATGGLNIPNMELLGIGNLTNIKGVTPETNSGAYGKMMEMSKGKDTTVGHWEIAGLVRETPFPSYPNGFPDEVIKAIEEKTGRGILCNLPYSGTKVLEDYGKQQKDTGKWIIYTSADPVLQIAANEEDVPIEELYSACRESLEICKKLSPVARVIARPYIERNGVYTRTSNRHDYAVKPDSETVLDRLKQAGYDVIAIGKINDIFAGQGITETKGTNKNNKDGIIKTITALKEETKGLIFTNLVDFDMLYGHRRDPIGYKNALEEFDSYIPEILDLMADDEILMITADHGCDPTFSGSDHTREYIPILIAGRCVKPVNLGIRNSFTDIASTIEELLTGKQVPGSFAREILN